MNRRNTPILIVGFLCFVGGWFFGNKNVERPTTSQMTERLAKVDQDPAKLHSQDSVVPGSPANPEPIASPSEIDFSLPIGELLTHANTIEDPTKRHLYLRNLIHHWMAGDPGISDEDREAFLTGAISKGQKQAFGFETELSYMVRSLSDPSIRRAWKDNYANHPSRSEIYAAFIQRDLLKSSPESLFQNSLQWNPWERARYNDDVIAAWAKKEPNRAFAWYESQPADFGTDAGQGVLNAWASEDFEGLSVHMGSMGNPDSKTAAIEALAAQMAHKGTDQALDWANSLSSPADRELAHDIIYRETPRGIGAILKFENGFPQVVEPLVQNGLLGGDLLVSATNNGNDVTDFFGAEITTAVGTLLGDPGSEVSVQIMRLDPESGEYRQMEIVITRQQLWLEDRG